MLNNQHEPIIMYMYALILFLLLFTVTEINPARWLFDLSFHIENHTGRASTNDRLMDEKLSMHVAMDSVWHHRARDIVAATI